MIKLYQLLCNIIAYYNSKRLFVGLFILLISGSTIGKTIIIEGKTIIDKTTVFKNVQLDVSNGYFQIINNAKLEIENCIIKGTLSPNKLNLIQVDSGHLVLKKNKVSISIINIQQKPTMPSLYYVINILQGKVTLLENKFDIATPYTVGLLATTHLKTTHFNISKNEIRNFHGGILLKNSHDGYIGYNKFINVSIIGIMIVEGSRQLIKRNTILFPGNNNVGDGIDIIDSTNIEINQNYIASGSCYSVIILRGKNIIINNNIILGGITYAIAIKSSITLTEPLNKNLIIMREKFFEAKTDNNQNIIITNNYLSQNRYGITATSVDKLMIENNLFIQRFSSALERKFWTNNNILFQNVSNLIWKNNFYKEAYDQEFPSNNKLSTKLVEFPLSGGVNL